MADVIPPLHAAPIGHCTVRFFASPDSRSPLPWQVIDDLWRAYGLAPVDRRRFLQEFRRQRPHEFRTVGTSVGPVVIAPHNAALGFILYMEEDWGAPAFLLTEYEAAIAEAWRKTQAANREAPEEALIDSHILAAGHDVDLEDIFDGGEPA